MGSAVCSHGPRSLGFHLERSGFRLPLPWSESGLACSQVQTLNEQDWERAQQASVLANVAQAFESDVDASDGEDDRDTVLSAVDLWSPSGQADAQTLAVMLQEQLDAINKEIRCALVRGGGPSAGVPRWVGRGSFGRHPSVGGPRLASFSGCVGGGPSAGVLLGVSSGSSSQNDTELRSAAGLACPACRKDRHRGCRASRPEWSVGEKHGFLSICPHQAMVWRAARGEQ